MPFIKRIQGLDLEQTDPFEIRDVVHSVFREVYFVNGKHGPELCCFRWRAGALPGGGGSVFENIAIEGVVTPEHNFTLADIEEQIPDGHRKCTKCMKVKKLNDYHKKRKDGGEGAGNRRSACRVCRKVGKGKHSVLPKNGEQEEMKLVPSYSNGQKAEVAHFVIEYNKKNNRGGIAAAVKEFGISRSSINRWLNPTDEEVNEALEGLKQRMREAEATQDEYDGLTK